MGVKGVRAAPCRCDCCDCWAQLYSGQFIEAMRTAVRLADYDDLVEPTKVRVHASAQLWPMAL